MRAGDQLSDSSAAPVGKVSKGHTGGAVGEESLVNVALVGVIVADEPRHAVETFRLVLAEVEYERNQLRQDWAEVHIGKVFSKAKEDLFDRVQACFVETVPGTENNFIKTSWCQVCLFHHKKTFNL